MRQTTQASLVKPLTIGQVAGRAGVGVETVRFYEREGLLPRPARRASGYRQYPEESVSRLQFIRRAKALGFTLKEIGELLDLRLDPRANRGMVKRRTAAKVEDIERKIDALRRMKESLLKLADACNGEGHLSGCPILGALEGGEDESLAGRAGERKECHGEHGKTHGRGVQRRMSGMR